jgi:hypothetical protein
VSTETDRLIDIRSELKGLLAELNEHEGQRPEWPATRWAEGYRDGLLRGCLAVDRALRGAANEVPS